ncbi:MAG: hypothetical protein RL235_299 [Chlamydiota bacterium]
MTKSCLKLTKGSYFVSIPIVIEKLISGGVGFSSDFSSSLAAVRSRAQPLAPDRESEEAFLPVSQFFNPSGYIKRVSLKNSVMNAPASRCTFSLGQQGDSR